MKFDLMYYLGMTHNEIMLLDLAELNWHYKKLIEVKANEAEVEKIKIEATLAALGVSTTKRAMGA